MDYISYRIRGLHFLPNVTKVLISVTNVTNAPEYPCRRTLPLWYGYNEALD